MSEFKRAVKFTNSEALTPLPVSRQISCRCCGKPMGWMPDDYPIHTRCISRHWSKHVFGVNASRCEEFRDD